MPEHLVRLLQPVPEHPDSWEFEQSPDGQFWQQIQSVSSPRDLHCYEFTVDLLESSAWVRARGVGGLGASTWSEPLAVAEPEFGITLALCVLGLLAARLKGGRSPSQIQVNRAP